MTEYQTGGYLVAIDLDELTIVIIDKWYNNNIDSTCVVDETLDWCIDKAWLDQCDEELHAEHSTRFMVSNNPDRNSVVRKLKQHVLEEIQVEYKLIETTLDWLRSINVD